jgi:hypothetical protein
MSGVAGADRIKSRQDFDQFLNEYRNIIKTFPGFVSIAPSGSYNSNPDKTSFGDIDLIVQINSIKNKAIIKKELVTFFNCMPDNVIVPFGSAKHLGKKTYNAGELVTIRYHSSVLEYSVQIDNIVSINACETAFKQRFLDFSAEKQGLLLGLVKIAGIENNINAIFKKFNINASDTLDLNQEYEFNLSSVELQLRKVTYELGTFKQIAKEVVWNTHEWKYVEALVGQYDLNASFDELLTQCKAQIKNSRSNARMIGIFGSMITVKSGEVGTEKGAGKLTALSKIKETFK